MGDDDAISLPLLSRRLRLTSLAMCDLLLPSASATATGLLVVAILISTATAELEA